MVLFHHRINPSSILVPIRSPQWERERRGTWAFCGIVVLIFFWCGDVANKISICGVAVISNLMVCDVCVFHAAVFSGMKLFAVLWFLVWLGDAVFVNFFCGVVVFRAMSPSEREHEVKLLIHGKNKMSSNTQLWRPRQSNTTTSAQNYHDRVSLELSLILS